MKRILQLIAAVSAAAAFSVSCTEKSNKIAAEIQDITGIEAVYALDKDEVLKINPEIQFTQGEVGQLTYQWTLGEQLIGEEARLSHTCAEAGAFDAAFKVSINGKEPFVKKFKVNVAPRMAMVKEVKGLEEAYENFENATLTITPEITFTEGEVGPLTYEWKIGEEVVGNEATLTYTCAKLGTFDGSFKVTLGENEPVVKNFTLQVNVPISYDNRGLLLLTEGKEGSMLAYKRLDRMELPVYKDVFKTVNPQNELGKKALDIAWFGAFLSDYNTLLKRSTDLDVLLSTDNPNKIYSLDPTTLKVKEEFSSLIPAQKILIIHCFQQKPWSGHRAYFIGNETEKVLMTSNVVSNSDIESQYKLSNIATSMFSSETDMLRIYYDHKGKTVIYHSQLLQGAMPGDNRLAEPIFLQAAMGRFDTEMQNVYFPSKVIAVTNDNGTTKAFILTPIDIYNNYETIDAKVETTGKILPESAIAVHPTEPVLYFSNAGAVSSLNIKTGEYKSLFTLEGNMAIKKIALNIYDPETLYIAAENQDEASELKASLFVYSIKDGAGKQLYAEHKVGAAVRQLIYKGDATENVK